MFEADILKTQMHQGESVTALPSVTRVHKWTGLSFTHEMDGACLQATITPNHVEAWFEASGADATTSSQPSYVEYLSHWSSELLKAFQLEISPNQVASYFVSPNRLAISARELAAFSQIKLDQSPYQIPIEEEPGIRPIEILVPNRSGDRPQLCISSPDSQLQTLAEKFLAVHQDEADPYIHLSAQNGASIQLVYQAVSIDYSMYEYLVTAGSVQFGVRQQVGGSYYPGVATIIEVSQLINSNRLDTILC